MLSRKALVLWTLFALVLLAAPASAQDPRGSIAGTVTDATGGVLPGVTVVVTNTETGVSQNTVTDSEGRYRVLYLNPGSYAVTAELSGFKKFSAAPTRVGVGDVVRVDVALETGGLTETVTVSGGRPAPQHQHRHQRDDDRQQADRGAAARRRHRLHADAPGAGHHGLVGPPFLPAGRQRQPRPASWPTACRAATSSPSTARRTCRTPAASGFSPPSDAISRVQGADQRLRRADRPHRRRGRQPGAQERHEQLSLRRARTSTATTAARRRRCSPGGPAATKPTREYNRYTGTLGGPVIRNRTFFMASFEHLRDVQPEPATYTVPTEKMRRGDFSEFATQIYDPLTATGTNRTRTPFPGNVIPAGRINPVAAAYAALLSGPEPARVRGQLLHQPAAALRLQRGHGPRRSQLQPGEPAVRDRLLEQAPGGPLQLGAGESTAGSINGFAVTQGLRLPHQHRRDGRLHLDAVADAAVRRAGELRAVRRVSRSRADFDPARLGFSPTARADDERLQVPAALHLRQPSARPTRTRPSPRSARSAPTGARGSTGRWTPSPCAPTVTAIRGGHTARAGYDLRYQRWKITSTGYPGGRFQFNGSYTRANNSAATERSRRSPGRSSCSGCRRRRPAAVATPGTQSSQFEIASPGEYSQSYHGLFLQDDWRVDPQLTLNLGLRLEINTGMTEAEDRNLAGFDTTVPNPIEARGAGQPTRANPIPEIPVSAFQRQGRPAVRGRPGQQDADQAAAAGAPCRICSTTARSSRRRRAVLLRLLLRQHQPGRLLAGDAGLMTDGQRLDVHRRER